MFEIIITRIQHRNIILDTDPLLQGQIVTKYQNQNPFQFIFSVFELIYAIGTCRDVAKTKANKFSLASDFLEIIDKNNANELRISIENPDIE